MLSDVRKSADAAANHVTEALSEAAKADPNDEVG
jgi:hypothetical protein